MKNQYRSSHYHRNEATLFLNPAKKQLIKKEGNTKLKQFKLGLVLVVSILFVFISYSALADELKDTWEIKRSNGDDAVFISKKGIVTSEDKLTYIMLPENCNDLVLSFTVTSYSNFIAQDAMKFKVRITEEPFHEYQNSVDVLTNKLTETGHVTKLIFPYIFDFNEHVQKMENISEIELKIIPSSEDDHVQNPSEIFDILFNKWSLDGFSSKLREGRQLCSAISMNYQEV